jgi:hypothetical protein
MSNFIEHDEIYKGYKIEILPDNDVMDSPREWDNAGKMVCWHNRYTLGDEQPRLDHDEWIIDFTIQNCKVTDSMWNKYNSGELTEEECWKILNEQYIFLPLYLYEHSGITMSTSGFSDSWDSGGVGWIYISKLDAVKEWGNKLFTKMVKEKAVKHLRSEVETYDDYLTGNVYGYKVSEYDAENDEIGDEIESCWGYYPSHGDTAENSDILNEARGIVDYCVKEEEEKKWENAQLLDTAIIEA